MIRQTGNDGQDELSRAFNGGVAAATYMHAIDTIASCLLVIIECEEGTRISELAWFQADGALVTLLSIDLDKIPRVPPYIEMEAYLPTDVVIRDFALMRAEKKRLALVPDMEPLIQQALLKFKI